MSSKALNKIRMQIMWDRLLAIVEEQAQTLIRTAFSTTVREAGDLSSGVFDTQGRMLAQAIKIVIDEFGCRRFREIGRDE